MNTTWGKVAAAAVALAAVAAGGLAATLVQDVVEEVPVTPVEGQCFENGLCVPPRPEDAFALLNYDKCVEYDTSCSVDSTGCAIFGLDFNCRGCFTTCEGAEKFLLRNQGYSTGKQSSGGVTCWENVVHLTRPLPIALRTSSRIRIHPLLLV